MLNNYLKVAFRNIKKNKIYSLINITGLAVGLAIFILFAIISGFNTEADKFHENGDRIFSVVQVIPSTTKGEEHTAYTPSPLLPALLSEFPQIEKGTTAFPARRMIMKYNENIFYENSILFADSEFLSVFTFDLVSGNPSTVLAKPFSIVISERMAHKYFGEENPIGKVLMLDNTVPVTVTGVIKDIDTNYSSIRFNSLVSIETAKKFVNGMNDWKTNQQGCFVMLSKESDPANLENKFSEIINKYYGDSPETPTRIYLLSLLDFRLHSRHISSFWGSTDGFLNYVLMVTGTLILLIVGINFVNLSTACYMNRIKEVGLRKVVGAQKLQLIKQFLSESIIMALFALPLSLIFYYYIMEALNYFLIQSQEEFIIWNHPFLYKYLLAVTILVGLIAGIYPAFFLSSFRPARILKGNLKIGKKGSLMKKMLVVSQFAMAILLIVLTLHWQQTHNYFFETDLGYNRDNVVTIKLTNETSKNLDLLQERIVRHTDVISVSAASAVPVSWENEMDIIPEGYSINEAFTSEVYDVDYEFTKTLGIEIIQGRGFSGKYIDENKVIINEILAKQLNWADPLGKELTFGGKTNTIVGVTKYFHLKSLNQAPCPVLLRLNSGESNYLLIRYSSDDNLKSVMANFKEDWQAIVPQYPFECYTLENYFYDNFRADRIFLAIFSFVDIIVIFISCLGLLGLASYAVQRRTKEIGIRKSLGASITGIIRMLIQEFLTLVFIANIIAIPVSYFICKSIFQYRLPYYRIPIGADVLILATVITIVTAVAAVIYQTQKAARANPIDSLRYE